MKEVFLINFVVSTYMLGVIWFVQIVHYPLFNFVSKDLFSEFENNHSFRTFKVVAIPMIIELLSSFILIFSKNNQDLFILNFLIVIVIWISTFLLQVPNHKVLQKGFSYTFHTKLVRTNWIRTFCWTLRAVLNLYLLRYLLI